MSSQPDRADSAPPSVSDSTSSNDPQELASNSAAADGHEGEAPRKSPSIRIGTQRYGVKPPPATPKPILPSPPPELLARPSAASSPDTSKPQAEAATELRSEATADAPAEPVLHGAAGASTAEQREAEQADAPAQAAPTRAPGRPPADRKRGDQKPRAPKFIPEPERRSNTPLPNTREQLSADLELEYMEALGGQPLEEIIASQPTEVAPELEPESRHKAKVVSVHRDNVFVELGGHQQGIVQLKNFPEPPEVGAVLDLTVGRFNAAEGLYEMVLPGGAVDVGDWSEVAEGMVVEARVTGHNKGGLECEVSRLRGFIPASQVSMYRVEDLAQFVDQKFACVITEANPDKRNLVLSRRAMLEREKAEAKEKLMAELAPGQVREGTVRSLQAFGAFVDLGGVDGLIHISQLSWDRIKHAEEVLQLGQAVKVKIVKIDPQTGKIGLAFRDLSENPWANAAHDFPSRSRVKGKVTRLMEFGAFVRLGPGVEGLIHISELSHKRVFRVSDMLNEGQDVEVMVLSVDAEQQRISLSLKALEAKAAPAEKVEPEEPEAPPEPPKKRKVPLKGGIGGPSTGDQFGLKW
jgi:predicted RNA-binding protein with RPS1 domain